MTPRPDKLTIKTCNDTGFIVEKKCKLPELKCYVEDGNVLFWATVIDRNNEEIEALQYLSAGVALQMAKSLEACAIQAFKNQPYL